jgi:FkbM family methyltransferase
MGLPTLINFVWTHPLNARGKWAALGRLAGWQVASRVITAPVALPFVEGTFLLASRGMTGATGNWYCGLHELDEMAFVLHVLRPGDHFVDVGANVGSYTVLAAGAVGAKVTAVEPVSATFAHLERNLALNDLGSGVFAWQGGLSDRPGTLDFTATLDTVNHVAAAGEEGPTVEVTVRTLDDLVGSECPDLLKIDVEGHERSVLLGAAATLANPRLLAIVMETNGSGARYGVDDGELFAIMRTNGFSAYGYNPFTRELVSASERSGNTVFVRNRAAVETRLRSSKRYRLVNGEI